MFDRNETVGIVLADKKPMNIYGSISAIRRIVLVLRIAGISPIIIVTGKQSLEVERTMSDFGMIFSRGEEHGARTESDNAILGLNMANRCFGKAVIVSTEYPLISPKDVKKVINCKDEISMFKKDENSIFPIGIQKEKIPEVLKWSGDNFIELLEKEQKDIVYFETKDPGININNKSDKKIDEIVFSHNQMLLQPYTITCIETEKFFFDKRTLLLLNLIEEFASVKKACEHMAISYAKAWDSLNTLEKILGYRVINRKHGGKSGGGTTLTEQGKRIVKLYDEYNKSIIHYSSELFFEMFPEFWENKNN